MQLTREIISQAAIEILDTYGLSDMTMRRLAKQLSVAPGALYWHFPSKQELIAELGLILLAPVIYPQLPDSEEKQQLVRRMQTNHPQIAIPLHSATDPLELSLRLRSTLLAHRDGAELVLAALSKPQLRTDLEQAFLSTLDKVASDPALQGMCAATLVHFAFGAVSHEQAVAQLCKATGESTPNTTDAASVEDQFAQGVKMIVTGTAALQ
ncbi:TetR/AcrR family transcriptional regulator [Corynebacterium choanae]|uniref:Tetracycline repressor protein class A n=1 Tax=Corynebacterium choanae TaxID=1862358 RepID=A0A3G6J4H4_9CORY|nr:helix-turn-helix domain-containing protein [Corynebacterium choanae]AZA12991.1 Tetracycline repressor protein class A [Corynebacterium choanae]